MTPDGKQMLKNFIKEIWTPYIPPPLGNIRRLPFPRSAILLRQYIAEHQQVDRHSLAFREGPERSIFITFGAVC